MNQSEDMVQKYVQSLSLEKKTSEQNPDFVPYPFITISRQTGAGGHTLAEVLLKKIMINPSISLFDGWQMFDHKIIEMVSKNPKLKVSVRSLLAQEYHTQIEDITSNLLSKISPQSQIIHEIFKIILSLATRGKVILVGRGASCLTKNIPGGVHVRLVASEETRSKRMCQLLNVSDSEAKRIIKSQDKSRAALLHDYFDQEIDDPLIYDVILNTDAVSMEVISSTVLRMVDYKMRETKRRNQS